jgi:hypothetical protein
MPSFATTSLHDVGRVQARTIAVHPDAYPGGYACLTLHLAGSDERPVEIDLYLPIDRAAYAARLARAINEVEELLS